MKKGLRPFWASASSARLCCLSNCFRSDSFLCELFLEACKISTAYPINPNHSHFYLSSSPFFQEGFATLPFSESPWSFASLSPQLLFLFLSFFLKRSSSWWTCLGSTSRNGHQTEGHESNSTYTWTHTSASQWFYFKALRINILEASCI